MPGLTLVRSKASVGSMAAFDCSHAWKSTMDLVRIESINFLSK